MDSISKSTGRTIINSQLKNNNVERIKNEIESIIGIYFINNKLLNLF